MNSHLTFADEIAKIAETDVFKRNADGVIDAGWFVGRPFHLDYETAQVLVADAWKQEAEGLPQGCFLLAYYENERDVAEALLLRVLGLAKLPTDGDVISSMVEYYKDDLQTSGKGSQLDSFTRYEFGFSGLLCRILGTFYRDHGGKTHFGADVENFYSSHNYSVYKPNADVLELIANYRESGRIGMPSDIRVGVVRYSSTRRFQGVEQAVPVYVSPADFLGKRTALFGMTRTGKSNTVKKIIQATVLMSTEAPRQLDAAAPDGEDSGNLDAFTLEGVPKFPVGQIVFDVNGEYANANLQDEGTAIFDLYSDQTSRYSTIEKPGFKVMKVNFYRNVIAGFGLVRSRLREESGDYVSNFLSVDLSEPENGNDRSAVTRQGRKIAAYLCCLHRAGFPVDEDFKVTFEGNATINSWVKTGGLDPSKGISLDQATNWFTEVWRRYDEEKFFADYKKKHGHEWADEDLKAILVFLTRKRMPGGAVNVSGFLKLRGILPQHTKTVDDPFDEEIRRDLRSGRIVIVDLSQGDPEIQRMYSERICRHIFDDSMDRFIQNIPNNFVQFYFEEAHNLFPKKEDKDLSQIYNRLAKEGAKLSLGLIYATQEVSSISANILKNTQNWFIAHLNNEDETREIRKYYDFVDFVDSLVRFSADSDRGYVRMKTYSNPYVVPVQVDRFAAQENVE